MCAQHTYLHQKWVPFKVAEWTKSELLSGYFPRCLGVNFVSLLLFFTVRLLPSIAASLSLIITLNYKESKLDSCEALYLMLSTYGIKLQRKTNCEVHRIATLKV